MTQKISLLTLAVVAAATLEAARVVGMDGNYATAKGNAFGVTTTSGAVLHVDFRLDGETAREVSLEGDAEVVRQGVLELGESAVA